MVKFNLLFFGEKLMIFQQKGLQLILFKDRAMILALPDLKGKLMYL